MENHSHSSVKPYIIVILALAALTGLTVFLSGLKIPHGTAILLAAIIATVKVSLIASVFMHLKSEKFGIHALVLTALLFVAVLIIALIPDIGIVK